jgi:hypothetical protein
MSKDDLVDAARDHGIAVSRRDSKETMLQHIAMTLKG